jgi:hypothetical protein
MFVAILIILSGQCTSLTCKVSHLLKMSQNEPDGVAAKLDRTSFLCIIACTVDSDVDARSITFVVLEMNKVCLCYAPSYYYLFASYYFITLYKRKASPEDSSI